jgi:hypothetical protein
VEAWKTKLDSLRTLAVSASGDALAVADAEGLVVCYSRDQKRLWSVKYPQVRRIALSNNGRFALSYSPLQPKMTTVSLLERDKTRASVKLPGPVIVGAISPDGALAAAVTQNQWLYLFRKKGKTFVHSRLHLSAPARALLLPSSGEVVIGYKGTRGVEAMDGQGHRRWRLTGQDHFVYDLYASSDGKGIGILAYRSGTGDRARAFVIAPNGTITWQAHLPGIFPRMALEDGGGGTAVGYTEVYRGAEITRYGRKVAYYDEEGNRLWEKGGVFFSPTLVAALSPGTAVLVRGPQMRFYTLDGRGAIRGVIRSAVTSLRTEASRNGRTLVVWGEDGAIHCFQDKGN